MWRIVNNNVPGRNVELLAVAATSCLAVASIRWQFWLLFDVVLGMVLVIYFSKSLRELLNIHSVVVGLIVLYALPSSILMLWGKTALSDQKLWVLFAAIGVGLMGYTCGVLFLRALSPLNLKRKEDTALTTQVNALFWLTYKHRFTLVLLLCVVLLNRGFLPRAMSYRESVAYRAETPGIILYFNSLIPTVFSALMIAMVSIIGDLQKYRKLSWLSYLLIILVALSIMGGHRIWIIALFVCLMLSFQPYMRRRHMLFIIIVAFFSTFLISGAIRYARRGETFSANAKNLYEYFAHIGDKPFTDVMWRWSALNTPFSTFITIIDNIPDSIDFDYFAYIKDASLLIPTTIYPERPLPHNQWYVKTFEPEFFQRGAGKTFYVLGFGYLFAGVFGVFVHLFLFGILFEWLSRFLGTVGTAAGLFLYSYFFVQLLKFVVGYGFVVFIKNSLILDFFVPICVLFLSAYVLEFLSPNSVLSGKYLRSSNAEPVNSL
jgi:hypothetical protein